MKTLKFDNRDDWMAARIGKITGSRLKNIIVKKGNGEKIGYYELIAERLALPGDGENPMERGTRLEDEAVERFIKETGKKVDTSLIIWTREDNEDIALSPDGSIEEENAAVEVKCLASARHIEAFLKNEVPDEYEMQVVQYFIVNEKLEKLYFVFYDPRLSVKDFFYITVTRDLLQAQIQFCLEYQKRVISEVNDIVTKLSF